MAKQKNSTTGTQAPEEAGSFQENLPSDTPEQKPETELPHEEGPQEPPAQEPADTFIRNVLQAFPTQESLWVDRHGGVFTADTPPVIRPNAVLYKNPFYKPQKC